MVGDSLARDQAEAGKAFDKDTKKLFDKFSKQQKRKVLSLMAKVARKEHKKTRKRLFNKGGLAKQVAKNNAFVTSIESSLEKGDYGTIFFGLTKKIRSDDERGRTKLIDDIGALYAFGKQNFAPIGSGDGSHQFPHSPTKWRKRGFVYSGGFPGALRKKMNAKGESRAGNLGSFGRRLKVGYVHPDIPPADEFLEQAEKQILDGLAREIPDAIRRAWEESGEKRTR
tara:strand:- start:217 stop:894 length:678 start_codon:yes stop_codon:yes gene_type:complete